MSERPLHISPRLVALLPLAIWVAIAGILVVAFNYDAALPGVAGFSGAHAVAAVLMAATWIGVGVYLVIKRKPRG